MYMKNVTRLLDAVGYSATGGPALAMRCGFNTCSSWEKVFHFSFVRGGWGGTYEGRDGGPKILYFSGAEMHTKLQMPQESLFT